MAMLLVAISAAVACPDTDGDTVCNNVDNCPDVYNPPQGGVQPDHDEDGAGDACDDWTSCAPLDDGAVHVPVNYDTFTPPAVGGSYNDQESGCKVTRITDAVALFVDDGTRTDPTSRSHFNSDNSRLMLLGEDGHFVVDQHGNVTRSAADLGTEVRAPIWSRTNPDVIYYVTDLQPSNPSATNYVKTMNVKTCASPTTLLTINGRVGFGGWETQTTVGPGALPGPGGIGEDLNDGAHLIISTSLSDHRVYTIATGALSQPISGGLIGASDVAKNDCSFTYGGKIVCMFHSDPNGNRNYSPLGIWLYHLSGSNWVAERQVTDWNGHGDLAYEPEASDPDCRDVFVMINDVKAKQGNHGCNPPGVEKVCLADSTRTCLLPLDRAAPGNVPWNLKSLYVSGNNDGSHPWVLVSTNDNKPPNDSLFPDTRAWSLPPGWSGWGDRWGKYFNEVLMVRLDGSEIHRLAHHRSRDPRTLDPDDDDYDASGFWSLSRGILSRDAKFALFPSNQHLRQDFPRYTDPYVIQTTPSTGAPPDPCGPCVVNFCSDVGSRCTWNETCGVGGCGYNFCCAYECQYDPTCSVAGTPPPNACSLPQ